MWKLNESIRKSVLKTDEIIRFLYMNYVWAMTAHESIMKTGHLFRLDSLRNQQGWDKSM